jgi:glucose/arabinose dehydrogenase
MRLRLLVLVASLLAFPIVSRSQTGIRATVYASGFTSPVAIVQDPTNRFVQFVVEQAGSIRVVRGGTLIGTFLDLRSEIAAGGERGLLGLAFSPDYSTSGRFFVNFTNLSGQTVVARFRRSSNPLVADPGSRFDLRWAPNGSPVIEQPFANHNGGHLEFGPDGHLFIGLGDGGSGSDPAHRAQNPAELLGKMLRVDIRVPDSNAAGYRVPPDNPFVSSGPPGTRPEIWSFGLRNPWRYTFDSPARGGTGALIMGDVGQSAFEEIDYEPRDRGGRNYGWRNREGAHDHVTSLPPAFLPLTDPIAEYGRSDGASITGGYVYRGRNLGPEYVGRYFFADFIRGRVWSLALTIDGSGNASASDRIEHTAELGGAPVLGNVSSFGLDADGELFIVNYSGSILRVLNPATPPDTPTGLHIVSQ